MKGSDSYRLSKFSEAVRTTKSVWVLSDVMRPDPTILLSAEESQESSPVKRMVLNATSASGQENGYKCYFCIPCSSAVSLGSRWPQFPFMWGPCIHALIPHLYC